MVVAVGLEAQQISHPHTQLGTIDGLAEKILGPGVEPEHLGVTIVEGRDHDDWDVGRGAIGLDCESEVIAIHSPHHDVEQNEIGRLLRHQGLRLFAARGHQQEQTFWRQHGLQKLPVLTLVIDDQDAGRMVGEGRQGSHERISWVETVVKKSW